MLNCNIWYGVIIRISRIVQTNQKKKERRHLSCVVNLLFPPFLIAYVIQVTCNLRMSGCTSWIYHPAWSIVITLSQRYITKIKTYNQLKPYNRPSYISQVWSSHSFSASFCVLHAILFYIHIHIYIYVCVCV